MSYSVIAIIAQDQPIMLRCRACVAQQAVAAGNTVGALVKHYDLTQIMWVLAAQPGWADAWASALASDRSQNPTPIGEDAAVITDGMILAAVNSLTT